MTYQRLAIVLGNTLFPHHKPLRPDDQTLFFMAEDVGLCTHFQYHKHKLMLFSLSDAIPCRSNRRAVFPEVLEAY